MKRFRIFTADRVAWWIILPLMVVAVSVRAAVYNRGTLPLGAWVTMLLTVGGWLALTGYYWTIRVKFVRSIAMYSPEGVAIIPGPAWEFQDVVSPHNGRARILETIAQSVAWWSARYAHPIRKFFECSTLAFTDQVQVWHGRGDSGTGALVKRAVGLTFGRNMIVTWLATDDLDVVLERVRHELAHVACNAMGIWDEAEAHKLMREVGWK